MRKASGALVALGIALLTAQLRDPTRIWSTGHGAVPRGHVTPVSAPHKQGPHVHHEPLITYYLSATQLWVQTASPEQWPATHVVRLPVSGIAPLTAATYVPSDLEALSSTGMQTFMVRSKEFFEVGGGRWVRYSLQPCVCPGCI